jgi:pimeloyl-ACP methyl ester carboxylesterase
MLIESAEGETMEEGIVKHCSLRQSSALCILVGILTAMLLWSCDQAPLEQADEPENLTIVFVHGAWGGGWSFHKVEPLLEAAGHTVYRPTMTGLGERFHLAGPEVDLSTHIEDIINLLEFERLEDVVLVGHSYGGMVAAGVAERAPQRIAKLVYLDAIVPENGESVMGLFGDAIDRMASRGGNGYEPWQLVPRWVEEGELPPVDVPQPERTFTEPIVIDNPAAESIPTVFILTVEAGKETDDFDPFADRARSRGWKVVEMAGSHNPHWYQPEAFVDLFLQVASE